MKRGWIITISVIVFVLGLLVLLSFTLFSLKEVKIDYRTSFSQELNDEDIIDSGKFAYKSSVFFHGKKTYIENIENQFPFVKVINIETVFPSTFVVHIAQRQEVFAVKYNNSYLICDEELKILKIVDSFSNDRNNSILILNIKIDNENLSVGDFLSISNYCDIYNSSLKCNRNLSVMQSIISSISYGQVFDDVLSTYQQTLTLNLFDGQSYIIKNCSYGLDAKVKLFYDVYSQIYTYIGKSINIDGQDVVLTEDNLKNAVILIDNYYDYSHFDENDCYFNIVELTNWEL